MKSTTKCGTCGASATLICGGCGDVAYCSKEHQKSGWKSGHKSACKAYKIENHSEYGRFLIASRQLKAGSRVLTKLKPSVVGPPLTNPLNPLICLNCSGNLSKTSTTCPQCKYSFCSKCSNQCKDDSEKQKLCAMLSKLETPAKQFPPLPLVTPLKFLLLKNSDPDLFAKLLQLESHVEELKKSELWTDYKSGIVEPLVKLDFDEDLICQVIGIICTNSFELLQPEKGSPQHGLFEMASLMNHDCIGNTRLVIDDTNDGFKLSVYASVQISKGSPILFNYVRPLDTHANRKENLYNFKFFTCKCSRCQDVTELKTFNSAYLCPSCQIGPVVKNLDQESYTCYDCQENFDATKAKHIDTEIENGRKKLGKFQARLDLGQVKQLNSQFERLLYPSHGFMLEIKQGLISCTASAMNNPGPSLEPQMQKQRIEWCDQVLDSLNILEPGLSIGRAMLLYEKQSSMVRLANLEFEKDPTRPQDLLKVLLEGMSLLQESKTSLDLEPVTSLMSKYVNVVYEDIKELSDYIEMVRELI